VRSGFSPSEELQQQQQQLVQHIRATIGPRAILAHRRMDSTTLHVNIEQANFCNAPPDEFQVKVAETAEEIKELLETGFEYVMQKDNLAYFRKRK
jgi:hypothetical protein